MTSRSLRQFVEALAIGDPEALRDVRGHALAALAAATPTQDAANTIDRLTAELAQMHIRVRKAESDLILARDSIEWGYQS